MGRNRKIKKSVQRKKKPLKYMNTFKSCKGCKLVNAEIGEYCKKCFALDMQGLKPEEVNLVYEVE